MAGHVVNEWFAIPGTVHQNSPAWPNDVNNLSTRRLAFSNFAVAGTKLVLAATGGHNDYSGNEVTDIDLNTDTPTWQRLHDDSPSSVKAQNVPYYGDGLPTSAHRYNSVFFSTARNRLILEYTRWMYGAGWSSPASNGFNLDNNTWDPAGTWADDNTTLPSVQDKYGNEWGVSNYFSLAKYSPVTDTWTIVQRFDPNQVSPYLGYDSLRDQLYQFVVFGGVFNSAKFTNGGTVMTPIALNDIGGAVEQFTTDSITDSPELYDPDGDRFLMLNGNTGTLYQVKPNNTLTWDMSIVHTTGATIPTQIYSFTRTAYIPALHGIVYMPSGDLPLYFMKTAN
jgi:hypothetical protein